MGYIRVPVETNPQVLAADIFAYIQTRQPTWTPSDGNLDVWIIRAIAEKAAENRTLASDVPDDIFASFGAKMVAYPPVDDVAASGNTTWLLTDTIGHTIPANTYVGIRDGNGDLQTFYTVADVIVAPGVNTTAVGEVVIRATEPGTVGNALNNPVELVTTYDWVTSVTLTGPTGGGVDAEDIDSYLNNLARHLQLLSTVPILPADFALAAMDADPGVYRAVAIDGYNPLHNLLTANEASFETSVAAYTGTNAALAQSATLSADGADSMRLTAASAADMSAELNVANAKAVTPGQTISAVGFFQSAVTTRAVKVGLKFYTAGNALIGAATYGATVNDPNGAWAEASVSAIAPATAAKVTVVAFVTAPANTEVHYVDKLQIRHGTGTDWVAGGTAETGNIRTITIAAVDANGNAVSGAIKTAIQNWINARREQNWVTRVIDPRYTQIDVTTTFKVLAGFDAPTVQADVAATISDYLNPSNWALDPNASSGDQKRTWVEQGTVYLNELIALVSNVSGVDRVVTLQQSIHGTAVSAQDVTIDNPAGLTTAGTIAATAV